MNDINDIIERLSFAEIDSAINKMVNNYDLTGKCYDAKDIYFSAENVFKQYFNLTPEIIELINRIAEIEYKEDKMTSFDIFFSTPNPEIDLNNKKDDIYRSILDHFALVAKKRTENREHLRIPIGGHVDYDKCTSHNSFIGKIEFYKDGGWGIGNENGIVVVKNHLTQQPSQIVPLVNARNCPYRIIQDRDTKKYGVISYASFIETIHCHYDKIEIVEFYDNSIKHYYIKVKKNEKWGCFDENCALIIDCKYDDIRLTNNLLECTRDGEYVLYDTLDKIGYDSILEGKKDLYNSEGFLLLGGYDKLEIGYDYFQFYFGTHYECSLCLILDKNFKTVLKNENGFHNIPKGQIINSVEELKRMVPSELLLKNRVNLSHIHNGFIYLHDYCGEQYLIPKYIEKGFNCPQDLYNSLVLPQTPTIKNLSGVDERISNGYPKTMTEDFFDLLLGEEIYEEDDIVTIIKLNENRDVVWRSCVNEIDTETYSHHIYRKGNKVGFYNENGLEKCVFDAITRESSDGKIYVAHYVYSKHDWQHNQNNPNYCSLEDVTIQYFSVDSNGLLTKIEDDWNIFNPTKLKWFPYDFISRHYDIDDGYSLDYSHERGYEWTEEDTWDAMTDGMYGDYPGGDIDYEKFGF